MVSPRVRGAMAEIAPTNMLRVIVPKSLFKTGLHRNLSFVLGWTVAPTHIRGAKREMLGFAAGYTLAPQAK